MYSKITLSAKEYELVSNADWFLTKQSITTKVLEIFSNVLEEAKDLVHERKDFDEILSISPKIFKGENYKGLPWVMLDYPRKFSANHIFAIRVMFWWANYFSVTLHLKGVFKEKLVEELLINPEKLRSSNFYLSINEKEWEHDLSEDNYAKVVTLSETEKMEIIRSKNIIKIAVKIPLTEWDNAVLQLRNAYAELFNLYPV